MTSDSAPLPRPSSAPEEVVDTAETTKPRQMMRRAVLADGDGFGVGGEQLHQRAGSEQADDRARSHDGSTHDEGEFVELFHAGVLFGTVIVANERAHTLHDAVGGQIQEGLQLVVNAQHHHVALGKARQQAVQEGDQQRWQGS